MTSISYSICMALLHSVWQAGLLWLVFYITEKSLQQQFTPLQKKNLLFISLAVQTALTIATFALYYSGLMQGFFAASTITGIYNFLPAETIGRIASWCSTAYCAVLFYKLAKALAEWLAFKRQLGTGLVKPPVELKLFTTTNQLHFGIKRTVQLWYSTTLNTPLTFGFLKPVIILPVALVNQLSVQQAETLILHELAHIKSNDYLLNWFLIIAETFFFFNPFIISFCKKIKLEREIHCDLTVTAFNYTPLLYAETLLQSQVFKQAMRQQPLPMSLAAVDKNFQLLHRIQFFTNPANQLQQTSKKRFPFLMVLLFPLLAAGLLLQLKPYHQQQPSVAVLQNKIPFINNTDIPAAVVIANTVQPTFQNTVTIAPAVTGVAVRPKNIQLEKVNPTIMLQTPAAPAEESFSTIPVAFTDEAAVQQVVVREEQSGSKNAVIKVYNVVLKDGKWILQPQWKLAAKEIIIRDSMKHLDTTEPLFTPADADSEIEN